MVIHREQQRVINQKDKCHIYQTQAFQYMSWSSISDFLKDTDSNNCYL
jgi:hypothetical protein